VGTTVNITVYLPAMTNDPAAAITALRCQCVDGTLETIKGMCLAIQMHLKTLVILVPAYFTRAGTLTAIK
jgi:hypothetical protein